MLKAGQNYIYTIIKIVKMKVTYVEKTHIIKLKEENKMFGRYRKCYCMNNDYQNNSYNMQNEIIEDKCSDVGNNNSCCNQNNYMDCCECGFEEEYNVFPENPMLAQSYVPIQYMDKTFKPGVGLKMGTIFPELVSPYTAGQSMREIEYIRNTNTIKEGCNTCQ